MTQSGMPQQSTNPRRTSDERPNSQGPGATPVPIPGGPLGEAPYPGRRGSLSRTISFFVGLMALLVMVSGGIGVWYAHLVSQNVDAMQLAATQSMQISNLQLKWLSVAGMLETLSTTHPSAQTQLELDSRLNNMEIYFSKLSSTKFGLTPEMIAANQEITQELLQVGVGMRKLSADVYDLTTRSDWTGAATRRETGLAELQEQLDQQLSLINANIETDLQGRVQTLNTLRTLASSLAGVTGVIGVIFAFSLVWLSRRNILRPMQQLTQEVQRITGGDFSPVIPLPRNDEIGELSHAIMLMTNWLRDSYEMLEQRVAERTQEVERRRVEIQVAAQVARDIASTHNLEALLNLAVNLVRDRFKFYHAGIFMNDDRNEYAVLRSATGEAGREMLERAHKLRIGQVGLVGHAAQTGEPRVALDVGQDAAHYRNPLLPETRAEAAIPLKTGGRVIGVLDVQSTQPNAFDEESLQALQVLADQLATAIQNARLLEEVQLNLADLQTAYGRIEQQAWERVTQDNPVVGYQYDGVSVTPITQAQAEGHTADQAPLSLPLEVRGTHIGSLEVWGPGEEALGEAEAAFLSTVSSRLSQVLEGARLFEEAQSRAAREQMINRLTASIARSLDMDGVLRTAALQLGELPEVVEAMVLLAGETEVASPSRAAIEDGSQNDPESHAKHNGGGNGYRP